MNKGYYKMNGISILGICLVVIGILIVIWGATLTPVNLLNSDFMSFAAGGILCVAVGICLISGLPAIAKIIFVWLSALSIGIYIYGFGMNFIIKLISFVAIAGISVWITAKFLK